MPVRPITDTLRMLHGGTFIDECSTLLADVVRNVDETGKAGKLTITLDIKKNGGAMTVLAKVSNKVPELAPDADLFWPTVEGNLSLQNPNQRNLDLQVAGSSKPSVISTAEKPTTEVQVAQG